MTISSPILLYQVLQINQTNLRRICTLNATQQGCSQHIQAFTGWGKDGTGWVDRDVTSHGLTGEVVGLVELVWLLFRYKADTCSSRTLQP